MMRRFVLLAAFFTVASGCEQTPTVAPQPNYACIPFSSSGQSIGSGNTVPLSVGCFYANEPCVAVKICVPGSTTNCQVIDHILLDTGSYGLRLFTCAVTIPLPNETVSGGDLAECVGYADNSTDWGPVKLADVYLGGETTSTGPSSTGIPIQIIDPNYANGASFCGTPEYSPTVSGFNGILGVGLLTNDCPNCTSDPAAGYAVCSGGSCTLSRAASGVQVTNPISLLNSADNNGTILSFPSVSNANGETSITGTMYLGVDTETNNNTTAGHLNLTHYAPADVHQCIAASFTDVNNSYTDTSLPDSFIDSGSNYWDFPDVDLTQCTGQLAGFYCAATTINATAAYGTGNYSVPITIANANILLDGNSAFYNVGSFFSGLQIGNVQNDSFDFGFPFFYGHDVAVGFAANPNHAGWVPPYWTW